MPLAGDNLLLDLSEENLPTGTQLQIGTATFEVTDVPHTGCQKFQRRYGKDALELVNGETYKSQRLRGLFIRQLRNHTARGRTLRIPLIEVSKVPLTSGDLGGWKP